MFKEGDRVLGRYQHKGKTGTVKESCERYTHLIWDGGKRQTRVLTKNLGELNFDPLPDLAEIAKSIGLASPTCSEDGGISEVLDEYH